MHTWRLVALWWDVYSFVNVNSTALHWYKTKHSISLTLKVRYHEFFHLMSNEVWQHVFLHCSISASDLSMTLITVQVHLSAGTIASSPGLAQRIQNTNWSINLNQNPFWHCQPRSQSPTLQKPIQEVGPVGSGRHTIISFPPISVQISGMPFITGPSLKGTTPFGHWWVFISFLTIHNLILVSYCRILVFQPY